MLPCGVGGPLYARHPHSFRRPHAGLEEMCHSTEMQKYNLRMFILNDGVKQIAGEKVKEGKICLENHKKLI
jgi:hypothetical protein